jgi:hypothetical protein
MYTSGRRYNAHHLALHRPSGKSKRLDLRRPSAGAIHHSSSWVVRLGSTHAGSASGQHRDCFHAGAGHDICSQRARSFFQCAAQLARIDAALGQEIGRTTFGEQRFQLRQFGSAERPRAVAHRRFAIPREENGALAAQVGRFESFCPQLIDERAIPARAGGNQFPKLRRVSRIAVRDHASRGVRRFARRFALLDH